MENVDAEVIRELLDRALIYVARILQNLLIEALLQSEILLPECLLLGLGKTIAVCLRSPVFK